MVDQTTSAFFEQLYDMTYNQTVLFVTKRCDDPTQVSDIVQETYADVFIALVGKELGYMKNPGAFVRHVAKKKLARYYDWKSRIKNLIPLFQTSSETDDEYEILLLQSKRELNPSCFVVYSSKSIPLRGLHLRVCVENAILNSYCEMCPLRRSYRENYDFIWEENRILQFTFSFFCFNPIGLNTIYVVKFQKATDAVFTVFILRAVCRHRRNYSIIII